MTYSEKSPHPYRESSAHKVLNPNSSTPSPSPTPASGQTKIDVHQLQKYVGNQAVAQSMMKHTTTPSPASPLLKDKSPLPSALPILQRALGAEYMPAVKPENTAIRALLTKYKGDLDSYMDAVSRQVDNARELIVTRAFANIPAVDGYMAALLENFDRATLSFEDYSKIGRQAGYWIESYVTKVINIQPATGLQVIYQAKRGDTRPDIVVRALIDAETDQYVDLAWLDITSGSDHSTDHILAKAGEWGQALYARELLYTPIRISFTDRTAVPPLNADLTRLSEQAKLLQEENERRQVALFAKYALALYRTLEAVHNEVKGKENHHEERTTSTTRLAPSSRAIKKPESPIKAYVPKRSGLRKRKVDVVYAVPDEEIDVMYAPWSPMNEYFLASQKGFAEYIGSSDVTQAELASFIMGWNGMLARYEKRTKDKTYSRYLLSKFKAGVEVPDSSGADGEILVNEWLSI